MNDIPMQESRYILNTYGRNSSETLHLVSGSGSWVTDIEGRKYLDCLGGIAVNALGHCYPSVVEAVAEQAKILMHTSNLYYTDPQVELAALLVKSSGLNRVFFANSGTEVNEAAIKMARRYFQEVRHEDRFIIITFHNSFHGRTLAALAATAQEKFHQGFAPLPGGFRYVAFNDLKALKDSITPEVAAVMVEPVQGESGVYPADAGFLRGLREICDQNGSLLIFDEVQCGCGRTGKLFAFQHYDVIPDIVTMAKALGGGMPIGALLAAEKVKDALIPGTHGSTFGGNPVVCAAAKAVWEKLISPGFLVSVETASVKLYNGLKELQNRYPEKISEVRGLGMMLAVELAGGAKLTRLDLQKRGLLVNSIGDNILRLLPPLTISEEEIELAINILDKSLSGEETE